MLKLAPAPKKNKHLPYIEIVIALTEKGKIVPIKQVWIVWNRIKAATCHSEKSFLNNLLQQQQLFSSSYQRTQPLVKFLNKTCLRSDFSAHCLSKLHNFSHFSLWRKRCTTTINPYSLLMILQSLQFILFCVRKMILDQNVVRMSKRLFLLIFWWRCTLHWQGKHCDLYRLWLWYCFLPGNSYNNWTDQPRMELHLQILWKTPVHSQQRSTYLFYWYAA